jgi:hypothetical protein
MTGVLFIPPHLAEEVVEHAERTYMREIFSHGRLREGIYTSSQMDTKWTPEIVADFEDWLKAHPIDEYAHVDWSKKEDSPAAAGPDEETTLG